MDRDHVCLKVNKESQRRGDLQTYGVREEFGYRDASQLKVEADS